MKREEAIEYNKNLRMYMQITDKKSEHKFLKENYTALDMAIKALEQEPILDKIRAEIIEEKDFAYADFEQYKVDYLGVDAEYVEDELPDDDFRYGMERCIEILNKYRTEN